MKFNEYCPLVNKEIGEAKCVEITAELVELKKEEYIIQIRKQFKLTNEEMLDICCKCPNYPFE